MENLLFKHRELFKSNNKTDLQEKRRKLLLREHKIKRSLIQDEGRPLHNVLSNVVKNKNKSRTKTFKAKYGVDHKLQLSEWLKEKPEELIEWILVPCPKGVRCMVIACNGRTEVYTKSGKLYNTFKSLLPGNVGSKNDITILDCIYVNNNLTFYVLDAISYGNQDLHYCEAQFRFFWITSKFLESSLDEISRMNEYKFVGIEYFDFVNDGSIAKAFQQFPLWHDNIPALDGYLFYHKEASYTCGSTPLVGWLFPFMVPEVLGFPVHSAYMASMPNNYINYLHYIVEFDEMTARKRKQQREEHTIKMEVGPYRLSSEEKELDESEDDLLRSILETQKDMELSEGVDCFEDIASKIIL